MCIGTVVTTINRILTSDLERKVDKMHPKEANRNMNENQIHILESFKTFIQLHKNQLESSGVPEHLWQSVHSKLINVVSRALKKANFFNFGNHYFVNHYFGNPEPRDFSVLL